ncbi:MAG: hypothetical protein ACRDY6_04350 [Acidimicrobiia bacterium]
MTNPVMVILRWSDDPEAALERYEQAVATWRERSGGHARGPARVMAGRSDRGGLVVVNVFASEQDHHAFHGVGELLSDAGYATPEVERVAVIAQWPPSDADEMTDTPFDRAGDR